MLSLTRVKTDFTSEKIQWGSSQERNLADVTCLCLDTLSVILNVGAFRMHVQWSTCPTVRKDKDRLGDLVRQLSGQVHLSPSFMS